MSRLPDDHMVTINDARKHGLCVRGLVSWARGRGLDTRRLIREGMSVGEIRAMGDGYGDTLLERLERNK